MEYTRFTPKQEIEIIKAFRENPNIYKDRDALIVSYIPLIAKIAGEVAADKNVQPEDLIGDGVEGVIYAIGRFDTEKKCQFNTYAYIAIRHAILKSQFLRNTIVAPYIPKFDVPRVVSIEETNDAGVAIKDVLFTLDEYEFIKYDISNAMTCLSKKEQHVINLRFGFNEMSEHSFYQIGETLSISHTWARKLYLNALTKLKAFFEC